MDGVVVPTQAGGSPTTLGIVSALLTVASTALGLFGVTLWFFLGIIPVILGSVVVVAALLFGMVWAWRKPDGLRVGATDLALMRGNTVLWRRPLVELERVDWSEGQEWLSLVTVDGEVRGASLGTLPPGAVVLLVHHLRSAVEKARSERAEPDAEILALVQAASGS